MSFSADDLWIHRYFDNNSIATIRHKSMKTNEAIRSQKNKDKHSTSKSYANWNWQTERLDRVCCELFPIDFPFENEQKIHQFDEVEWRIEFILFNQKKWEIVYLHMDCDLGGGLGERERQKQLRCDLWLIDSHKDRWRRCSLLKWSDKNGTMSIVSKLTIGIRINFKWHTLTHSIS